MSDPKNVRNAVFPAGDFATAIRAWIDVLAHEPAYQSPDAAAFSGGGEMRFAARAWVDHAWII